MQESITQRLEFAVAIAREAGENTLRFFQRDNFHIERKADTSPVTEADKSTEILLRQRIEAAFSDDAILGEEFPSREGTSGFRWILDPIDGTKSFIHGVPLYGTLVAVEWNGTCVIGVIRVPALDEMVYAATGQGAWYVQGDGEPVAARVTRTARLADATVLTTSDRTFQKVNRSEAWKKITDATQLTRMWGDCYGYLLVATGRADAMIDPQMSIWDSAALVPVIQEAGGIFTGWNGEVTHTTGDAIVSNGVLHEEIMALIR